MNGKATSEIKLLKSSNFKLKNFIFRVSNTRDVMNYRFKKTHSGIKQFHAWKDWGLSCKCKCKCRNILEYCWGQ